MKIFNPKLLEKHVKNVILFFSLTIKKKPFVVHALLKKMAI